MIEHTHRLFADGFVHRVKHIVAFVGIGTHRIFVAHGANTDALAQLIHRIDVIHPLGVHRTQKHHALDFTHDRGGDFLFFAGIEIIGNMNELILEILRFHTLELSNGHRPLGQVDVVEIVEQAFHFPLLGR